ncbi:hypothetical protein BKA03_000422 [Demequina lutea]|uniref:Uncharacterized protein n=1 Tax=Demequina lutea TaxID=431489 RepID=A0A7Z0CIW4_9MICO|nr:hypothetical protein [Demequina lutea]
MGPRGWVREAKNPDRNPYPRAKSKVTSISSWSLNGAWAGQGFVRCVEEMAVDRTSR